jgi:hypothetical protein
MGDDHGLDIPRNDGSGITIGSNMSPGAAASTDDNTYNMRFGDDGCRIGAMDNGISNKYHAPPPAYDLPNAPPLAHTSSATKDNPFAVSASSPPPPPPVIHPNNNNTTPLPSSPSQRVHQAPPPAAQRAPDQPPPTTTPTKPTKVRTSYGSSMSYGHWNRAAKGLFAQRPGCTGLRLCLAWAVFAMALVAVLAVALGVVRGYRGGGGGVLGQGEGLVVDFQGRRGDGGVEGMVAGRDVRKRSRKVLRPAVAHGAEMPAPTNIVRMPSPQRAVASGLGKGAAIPARHPYPATRGRNDDGTTAASVSRRLPTGVGVARASSATPAIIPSPPLPKIQRLGTPRVVELRHEHAARGEGRTWTRSTRQRHSGARGSATTVEMYTAALAGAAGFVVVVELA